LKNNPNVIEILFVNDKAIKYQNYYGVELLKMKHLFPSQQCIPRFIGYAHAQKHKMVIKRDHFNELRDGYQYLSLMEPKLTMGQVYDRMIATSPNSKVLTKKETGIHIHCGDICFEPGIYAKKALKMLKERLDKATNRSELVLKHGYDTKFASHLIRLLYEGLMLLEHGEIIFPLPMADLILDIKAGKKEIGQVIELADKLESKFEAAREKTKLPKNSNYKEIEKFTISCMSRHLNIR
jgi:hypothetical protein